MAGNLPISVGVGLSIQMRGTDQVLLTLFGDGAANEGAFHESLNMAKHLETSGDLFMREQPVCHVHGI